MADSSVKWVFRKMDQSQNTESAQVPEWIEPAMPAASIEEGLALLAAFTKIASPEKRSEALAFVKALAES